jgi:predicted porin
MSADRSRSSKLYRNSLYLSVALSALMLIPAGSAEAQSATDAQVKALQAQIDQLQRSINQMKAQQTQQAEQTQKTQQAMKSQQAAQAQQQQQVQKLQELQQSQHIVASANMPTKGGWFSGCDGHGFLERKPGAPLTIYTCGGELTAYGQLDVSLDAMSKNVGHLANPDQASGPVGNFGWMPDISTNISYFGIRGFQHLYDPSLNFVYQLEAGFAISATPSNKQSNSNLSDSVNGALFSRNSYVGFASTDYGAIKIGKTDAPYKNSTAMFNPFAGEIGDYAVIMGNTGGDNRVEFGTRLDHAIWYESPNLAGWQFNALYALGQNRSNTNDDIPAGESDCTGSNDPSSGGDFPAACNDGAFGDAVSANLSYTAGGFYFTGAYERHFGVNRQSDITGMYGITTFAPGVPFASGGTVGSGNFQTLYNQDVADEDAWKVGALYNFKSTGTTVGAIFEDMHRYVPADLEFQNERTRNGTWLFLSQQVTNVDSVHFGWAHAFATPGDPGQHNDLTLTTSDGLAAYAPNDNQADMVTAAYKRKLSDQLTWYTAIAATFNGPSAHYDLGAGGRDVTTDCHDAQDNPATGGAGANPHCFTGTTLMGVSTGVQYRF